MHAIGIIFDEVFVPQPVDLSGSNFIFEYPIGNSIQSHSVSNGTNGVNTLSLGVWRDVQTGLAKSISNRSHSASTATITTSMAHGLISGTFVNISGVVDSRYNVDEVQITVVSPTQFTYSTDLAFTEGSIASAGTMTPLGAASALESWGSTPSSIPAKSTISMTVSQTRSASALFRAQSIISWSLNGGTYTGRITAIAFREAP